MSVERCPGCEQASGWCQCDDQCDCAWCEEARNISSDGIVERVRDLQRRCWYDDDVIAFARQEVAAERRRADDLEQELRFQMWVSHGHNALYGDDGEMQCCKCNPFDYKRAPLDKVRYAYTKAKMEMAAICK